jgi:hypothetical protein
MLITGDGMIRPGGFSSPPGWWRGSLDKVAHCHALGALRLETHSEFFIAPNVAPLPDT